MAKNVHALNPDAIYVCSNFIRAEMLRSATFTHNLFVTHYGVNRWNWVGSAGGLAAGLFRPRRDPRRLIYSSHPSKGFEAAREIARRLYQRDQALPAALFRRNQAVGRIGSGGGAARGAMHLVPRAD